MAANISRRTFLAAAGTSAAAAAALTMSGCGSSDVTGSVYDENYTFAVGTDNAPFSFTDDDGNLTGLEVSIVSAALDIAGVGYEFKEMSIEEATEAAKEGSADGALAAIAIDDEDDELDFTSSYYDAYVAAAVNSEGKVWNLDDAKGKKVACVSGGKAEEWVEDKKKEYNFTVEYYDTSEEAAEACTDGDAVLCVDSFPIVAYGITNDSGLIIVATEAGEYTVSYGIAVAKGTGEDLIEAFETGIAELRESGEYDDIINEFLS